MKMNTFAVINKEEIEKCGFRSRRALLAVDLTDPDEELVDSVDESRMSSDQLKARKFLKFLAKVGLTMELVTKLSPADQKRIREEFLSND